MNARDKAITLRLVELLAVLALLIGGVAFLARQAGETAMLGIPNKLFFGLIGAGTAIYVALAFSKFMFKNLPSAYREEKGEPQEASQDVLGRYQEIKYSGAKKRGSGGFEKYYTPLPKPKQKG